VPSSGGKASDFGFIRKILFILFARL